MKIALIGRFGETDIKPGPERVACELFQGIKAINPDTDAIEYFFKGYSGNSFVKRVLGRKNLNETQRRFGIIPILYHLFSKRYDVVHFVNIQRFILFILLIKPLIRSKFVVTLHSLFRYELRSESPFINSYYLDMLAEKAAIKRCDLIIFPSTILLEVFSSHYKLEKSKCRIIPNGVGEKFNITDISFSPVKDSLDCVFYNGFTALINRGLKDLYNCLVESKIKIRLFILGYKSKDIYSTENLEIIQTGLKEQSELIEFLKDKHVVIKADAFDTFPLFVIECMSLGLIPVISSSTGVKDYIQHGLNGFIYDLSSGNLGLINLLYDISIGNYNLISISCNARKIYEELNWHSVSNHYIIAYKTIL